MLLYHTGCFWLLYINWKLSLEKLSQFSGTWLASGALMFLSSSQMDEERKAAWASFTV
jgi:hypothetical protein